MELFLKELLIDGHRLFYCHPQSSSHRYFFVTMRLRRNPASGQRKSWSTETRAEQQLSPEHHHRKTPFNSNGLASCIIWFLGLEGDCHDHSIFLPFCGVAQDVKQAHVCGSSKYAAVSRSSLGSRRTWQNAFQATFRTVYDV